MANPFQFDYESFGQEREPLANIATGVVLDNEHSDRNYIPHLRLPDSPTN